MKIIRLIFMSTILFSQDVSCSLDIEYYTNGNIEFCNLAQIDTLSGQILPKGTGVHFTNVGVFNWCFLPEDMFIQGHKCRGGGHSFMTSFYPNGQLKIAWLAENEIIQEIPCSKFRFLSAIFYSFHGKSGKTSFYDNGQLKYCELSKDKVINSVQYSKGDAVNFMRN
jgi:hypothetical protein